MPYSRFDADFSVPELPRWSLHDKDDQLALADAGPRRRVVDAARPAARRRTTTSRSSPTSSRGGSPTPYDVNAESDDRAAEFDRLTMEQATILRVTRLLNRVEVRGGAGSGKTVLALQQAKELARGGQGRKSQRVALLCYSIGLAEHLRRQVAHVGPAPPAGVRRHLPRVRPAVGRRRGRSHATASSGRSGCPAEMADARRRAARRAQVRRGDRRRGAGLRGLLVDAVLRSLRDEEQGGLYVYSDENQRIFARFGRPPVALVPLVLDHNLRNTQQIHESFGPLAPSRMYSRGGDGPAVRFVAAAPEDAIEAADDAVDSLLEAGWEPEQRRPAHHRPPPPGPGRAHRLPRPGRLLGHVLGRRRLLRPRARLQGTRAPRGRAVPQRGRITRPCPRAALRRDVARH